MFVAPPAPEAGSLLSGPGDLPRAAPTDDLRSALQSVTDAGVQLTGAEFGAFFYSGQDEQGQRLDLYVLSGAAAAAFPAEVPVRHTALFAPTFSGQGVLRLPDVLSDERYGANRSRGIPDAHLPVRSYLAVPVVTGEQQVLGALLFGHSQPGRFDERTEVAARALAAHAATAAENARLLGAAQHARDLAQRAVHRLDLLQQITAVLARARTPRTSSSGCRPRSRPRSSAPGARSPCSARRATTTATSAGTATAATSTARRASRRPTWAACCACRCGTRRDARSGP